MLAAILGFFSAIGPAIGSFFGWRTETTKAGETIETEDAGAAKAEAETMTVIAEKADEQARNNAASRSVDTIADRLLREASAGPTRGDPRR